MTVPQVRIGGVEIGAMPVAFVDAQTFRHFEIDDKPALLLGMDVLRRFRRVAIDFRRRRIRFQLGRSVTPILRGDGASGPDTLRYRPGWTWQNN